MTTAKKTAPAKKAAAAKSTASTPETPVSEDATTTEDTATPAGTDAAPLDSPDETPDSADGDSTETPADGGDGGSDHIKAASGNIESGPMTGVNAPPEDTARPPATIVNTAPDAAPLDPPADSHTQMQPKHGHDDSTTNHTYAAAGGRTIAGETHRRIVDADGNDVAAEDLFLDAGPASPFLIASRRLSEVFTYQGAKTETRRLLFTAGASIPRAQAEQLKAAMQRG